VELDKIFKIRVNSVINEYKVIEEFKIECTEPTPPPPTVPSFEILTNNIIAHCEINNGKVALTRNKMKHAKFDVIDRKPIKPNEIRYYPQ
jgi:hypothetical protein